MTKDETPATEVTKDETQATEVTKDETQATEVTKDETQVTEVTEVAETTTKRKVIFTRSSRSKRRSRRWRLVALSTVGSVATILALLDDIYVSGKSIINEIERNECSTDWLGQEDVETKNGTLDGSCSTEHYPGGEYAKYYGFTLDLAATVTMEMTSRDVDSWLVLRSGSPPGSARVLEKNDDGGDGVDARIERSLDAGTYTIETTTL